MAWFERDSNVQLKAPPVVNAMPRTENLLTISKNVSLNLNVALRALPPF